MTPCSFRQFSNAVRVALGAPLPDAAVVVVVVDVLLVVLEPPPHAAISTLAASAARPSISRR